MQLSFRRFFSSAVAVRKLAPATPAAHLPDIEEIQNFSSSQLNKIAVSAADRQVKNIELWAAISQRTIDYAPKLKVWDAIAVLKSVNAMGFKDQSLFMTLGDLLPRQASSMTIDHICDLLTIYETAGVHPRALYVELMQQLMKSTERMYGSEFALVLTTLAQLKLGNPEVLKHYCRSVVRSIDRLSYMQACQVSGALRALGVTHQTTFDVLDVRQQKELQMLPLQELVDVVKTLRDPKAIGFFWKPHEDAAVAELSKRLREMPRDPRFVSELDSPFETLDWLRANGLVETQFLLALAAWCRKAVGERAANSNKRPLAHQLLELHEHFARHGLDAEPDADKDLVEAIKMFTVTRGGDNLGFAVKDAFVPLHYNRREKKYVHTEDPLTSDPEAMAAWPAENLTRHPQELAAPAMTSPWGTSLVRFKKESLQHRGLRSERYGFKRSQINERNVLRREKEEEELRKTLSVELGVAPEQVPLEKIVERSHARYAQGLLFYGQKNASVSYDRLGNMSVESFEKAQKLGAELGPTLAEMHPERGPQLWRRAWAARNNKNQPGLFLYKNGGDEVSNRRPDNIRRAEGGDSEGAVGEFGGEMQEFYEDGEFDQEGDVYEEDLAANGQQQEGRK